MDGNFMEHGKLFVEKGEALINLGNALQNPKTKIDQLVELADSAGFGVEVALHEFLTREQEESLTP